MTLLFTPQIVFMRLLALMLSALTLLSAFMLFPLCTFSQTALSQTAPPKSASTLAISGTVREAGSGEVVIGANVFIVRDTNRMASGDILRGVRTNKFGYFSLPDVPEGSYFLVVRSVSFKTVITPCSVPMEKPLTVLLPQFATRTKEVTVRAARDLRETVQSVSRVEVRGETIGRLPAIAGQKDVFRALQLLPGVQSAGELSSGLYVRGGSPDQNLTLLDGAIIYNPSHLAGFFSTFTADAVQDVRLYKGAFPAEYGGRLSSVIDITMKEGNEKRIKGNATLSTILVEANADGPIPYTSSNATFMLSGRRMIFDLFLLAQQELTDQIPSGTALPLYYFYDINAKLNYKLSDNDRLFLSLYNGRDVLDFDVASAGLKLGLGYGNLSGNLRWAHIVSPSLFTNFSLIYTKYDYSTTLEARTGRLRSIFSTFSQIEDWTLRGEAEWLPAPNHAVKVGMEAIRHQFSTYVGSRIESIPTTTGASGGGTGTSKGGNPTPTTGNLLGAEAAFYAQDEWNIDNRLLLNLGARLSWFQAGGQINLEPRISAGYSLTNDVKLTTSFSIVNQYVHLLSRNDITLPSDTWLPATRTILPSRSMQGTLGAEVSLLGGEITATVEGYYKTMENLYEYRDGTLLNTLNTERLEEQLTRGSGVSYGAEILLERKQGQLTGWLGYTLSWATRTFPELNGGRPFAPRYDKRHNISLALTYTLDEQWEFGATWTYITGQPITLPAGKAAFEDIGAASVLKPATPNNTIPSSTTYYTTERNGSRMTPFHKLDLSVTMRTIVFGFFPGEYFISIYNAYNQMNPFAWFISTDGTNPFAASGTNTGASSKPVILQFTLFPIFPTIGTRITL